MPLIRKAKDEKWVPTTHDPNSTLVEKLVLFGPAHPEDRNQAPHGRLIMVQPARIVPGGYFSQHHHGRIEGDGPNDDMAEVFLILDGSAILKIDGVEYEMGPYDLAVIWPGEVHSMRNPSDSKTMHYMVFALTEGEKISHVVSDGY